MPINSEFLKAFNNNDLRLQDVLTNGLRSARRKNDAERPAACVENSRRKLRNVVTESWV